MCVLVQFDRMWRDVVENGEIQNERASITNVPKQLRLDLALTNTQITSWV